MKTGQPLVSIIILNWNGWRDTLQCLASLRELTYPSYETVVVDNASTDDSVRYIHAAFPEVAIVQNSENLGYTGGNNVGFRYGLTRGAQYFWVLNNDTFVAADALTELVVAIESEFTTGIVGSKIYYASPANMLWFAGGAVNLRKGHVYHLGIDEMDVGQYDEPHPIDYAVGASMLVSRAVIEQTGGFDESYFLYFDETELCYRARAQGFRTVYAPRSVIWHRIARSTVGGSPTILYYYTRNNLRFIRRYGTRRQFISALPYTIKRSYTLLRGSDKQANESGQHHPMTGKRIRVWLRALADGLLDRGGRRDNLH